jgi:FkbM family methyltransferase
VDCGAYDGDTLRDLMAWTGGRYRGAMALEADPANFAALQHRIEEDPNLRGRACAIQAAVGRRRAKVRFRASGLASAAVSESGGIEVDSVSLDECLAGESPTFIKMDIEGAEMDALEGASEVLREQAPLLAICAYHTQGHLWQIPLRIGRLMPAGRLSLRAHCMDGFDLVCYAVPPHRAMDSAREDG